MRIIRLGLTAAFLTITFANGTQESSDGACPCTDVLNGMGYGGTGRFNVPTTNDAEVVVAYCESDLEFLGLLRNAIEDQNLLLTRITVITWCGKSRLEIEHKLNEIERKSNSRIGPTPDVEVIDIKSSSHDYCFAYFFAKHYASLASRLIMVCPAAKLNCLSPPTKCTRLYSLSNVYSDICCDRSRIRGRARATPQTLPAC